MQDSVHKLVGQSLIADEEALTRKASWYHRNKGHIQEVATALSKIEIQSAVLNSNEVTVSITGDKHTLGAVFGAFRKLGYAPSNRPTEKPSASFSCWWNHPDHEAKFWLSFSSVKCTRVKVGTETREVDIYETICE